MFLGSRNPRQRPSFVANAGATPSTTKRKPVFCAFKSKAGATTRYETLEGKRHLVVPMVMLVTGVHNGSLGPVFYPDEELAKVPAVWNAKPVVVYHPEVDGKPVSACTPEILSSRKVGVIMNASAEEGEDPRGNTITKLSAEAWIDEARLKKVDKRVLDMLAKKQIVEVSTGLWSDNDGEAGEWNGEPFDGTVRNYKPDHLAILPDQIGACSVEDGGGLLRNEASFGATADLLQKALRDHLGKDSYGWVVDVFKSFCVYSNMGSLYKIAYTVADTKATLGPGDPVEVVRFVQYRLPEGTVVLNHGEHHKDEGASPPATVHNETETNVKKSAMVAALIASGLFTNEEKGFLDKKSEDQLAKILPKELHEPKPAANADEASADDEADEKPTKKGKVSKLPTGNAAPTTKEETVEDYINKAPGPLRSMLANALRTHGAEKKKLVTAIMANEKNKFSEAKLNEKDLEELEAIHALMGGPKATDEDDLATYEGLADAYAPNTNEDDESESSTPAPKANAKDDDAPLPLPRPSFTKAGK